METFTAGGKNKNVSMSKKIYTASRIEDVTRALEVGPSGVKPPTEFDGKIVTSSLIPHDHSGRTTRGVSQAESINCGKAMGRMRKIENARFCLAFEDRRVVGQVGTPGVRSRPQM
jgi:hypothetical protein